MDEHACPFCYRIASLSTGADQQLVWQFPRSVVFLGEWQYFQGYCVVVSRTHATELFHLDAAERREFLDEMCVTAKAIHWSFRPHKLNYELLGNQVPHLHWHVFPRYLEDPDHLKPVWIALERADKSGREKERLESGPLDRQRITEALRKSLRRVSGA